MAEFNFDNYLKNRFGTPNPEKIAEVERAGQEKTQALREYASQLRANRERNADSLVNQLGLDPNGVPGAVVNGAVSGFMGATRLVGQVGAMPWGILAGANQANLSEDDIAALGRHERGAATAEDLVRINRKVAPIVSAPPTISDPAMRRQFQTQEQAKAQALADTNPDSPTPLKIWGQMNQQREVARSIMSGSDYSKYVHQGARDSFVKDIVAGFDPASEQFGDGLDALKEGRLGDGAKDVLLGVARLLLNAGEATLKNPRAATEFMLENAPQLFVGAAGKAGQAVMSASNVGYGLDLYNQGIENYQGKNGGALPPEDVRQTMLAQSFGAVMAEQAGDVAALGFAKAGGKSADAARTSFKQSLINPVKAAGKGALVEGPTEGVQTFLEGEITGKPATGAEIYTGAVIGAASGAGLAGGGRAVAEGVKATPEHIAERKKKAQEQLAQDELLNKSIESGDLTPYIDPKSPNYAPEKAVAALIGNSQKEDATDETRQKNLAQAEKIVSDLEEQRSQAKDTIDPEQKNNKDTLAGFKESLAKVTVVADREALAKAIKTLETQISTPIDPKLAKQTEAKIAQIERKIAEVIDSRDQLKSLVASKVDVDALVKTISTPTPVTGDKAKDAAAAASPKAAVERVISLAMASPESLTPEVATQLADDTKNALTAPQRDFLRKFSQARITQNLLMTMEKVSQEIVLGSDKNKGIQEYAERVGRFMTLGNQKAVQKELAGLAKFEQDHSAKSKVVAQAVLQFSKHAKPVQVVSDGQRGWSIHTGPALTREEVTQNGGLTIHRGTPAELSMSIRTEAQAIGHALAELQSVYDLKFSKEASDVKDTSQQGPGTKGKPQAPAVQDAQATGGDAAVPGDAGGKGRPAASVEAAGVGLYANDKGEPVALYHGSEKGLKDGFKPSEPVYLTPSRAYAEEFTPLGKGEIGTFHARISKPLIVDTAGEIDGIKYNKEVLAKLKADGYDAVIFRGKGHQPQVLVFDSSQLVIQSTEGGSASSVVTESTQESEKTQETEVTGDEIQSTAESTTVEAETTSGVLDVIGQKSPEGTSFLDRVRNGTLIGDYFTQVVKSAGLKTRKALIVRKDFLSAWLKGEDSAENYLGLEKGQALTSDQQNALKDLQQRLVAWNARLGENLELDGKKGDAFKTEDMTQFLLKKLENGVDLEENIKTAMSYAAYQWVVLKSAAPRILMPDEILAMHGRDKGEYISPKGKIRLGHMAGFEDRIISDLGKAALRALGLQATKNAPQELLPRLESALGTHIMAMMEKEKLITRGAIPTSEVAAFFQKGSDDSTTDPDAQAAVVNLEMTSYIQLRRNKEGGLGKYVTEIKQANQRSYDVVNRVFGEEEAPRFASFKPVKFVQRYAKRTKQQISRMQRRVIQGTMDTPHKVIPEMLELNFLLGRDQMLKIAGYKDLNADKYHEVNLYAIDAQNQNLEVQYDLAMEMLQNPANPEGYDTEFFVTQQVWKNYRAGFTTQSLNQQTSKIHRYLFARPSWKTELDLSNSDQVDAFMIAVAQAFGVNIDRQVNARTIQIVKEKLEGDSRLMQAIDAIRRTVDSSEGMALTAEEQAIVTDVATEAEGMQTLQAMVAYAKYENARLEKEANPEKPVKVSVTMLVGADGKTSGPMLTHLALGAASTTQGLYTILNRGGMYSTTTDDASHFSEWYSRPGSRDLYESTTGVMLEVAEEFISTIEEIRKKHKAGEHKAAFKLFTVEQWNSFQAITKALKTAEGKITSAGRNQTKTPITAFGFGAALGKAVLGMENVFIENLYNTIQDIAQGNRTDLPVEEFIKSVNILIAQGDYKAMGLSRMPIQDLLKFEFSAPQEIALRRAFKTMMGNPLRIAMQSEFPVFILRRTNLNKTIGASFMAYQTIYAAARIKHIESLMDSGEVAFRTSDTGKMRGVRIPLHGLSQAQEEAFRSGFKELLPVMHTDYSLAENDNEGGLYMAKEKNAPETTGMYRAKVKLASGITNSNGKRSDYLSSFPVTPHEFDPGVAGAAYAIHSLDSAGIHKGMDAVPESMNVHDEIGASVGQISKAAQAINKGILESLLEYSPAAEAMVMFSRLVMETAKRVKDGSVERGTVIEMFEAWADIYNRGTPMDITADEVGKLMLQQAFSNAVNADTMRLGAIAQMAVMDQYPWEGGSFEVTQEIRDEAAKRLAALPKEPKAELKEAIEYLQSLVTDKSTKAVEKPEWAEASQATVAEDISIEASEEAVTSPFGELGKSAAASDKAVLEYFTNNPHGTFRQAIVAMYKRLNGATDEKSKFRVELLKLLSTNVMNKDMVVRFITKDTPQSEVLRGPSQTSRAWYVSVGDRHEVNVLGPDFKDSWLDDEVLLHEFTHAAVARTVEAELAKKKADAAYTSEALSHIEELQRLYDKVKKDLSADVIKPHADAMASLQEFIAWGMTNQAFQQDVLMQVTTTSKTGKSSLITGMKKFIDAIVGVLFSGSGKKPQAITVNGMTLMVKNVAGLFAEANKAGNQSDVNLSMATASPIQQGNTYTTMDIYDALQPVHAAFDGQLRQLLTGIVTKLHGPFGSFKAALMQDQAITPMDVWLKALTTGVAPFASKIQVSGFQISEQEMFAIEQVEATVRAALEGNEALTKFAYKELAALYTETYQRLSKDGKEFHTGNWATATQADKDQAKRLYDFVFDVGQANAQGKLDYLSRFAALGLAHQGFNKILQVATNQTVKVKPATFADRLQSIFERVLQFLAARITHTHSGQQADLKLNTLVKQLVDIEARKRHSLTRPARMDLVGPLERGGKKAVDFTVDQVVKGLNAKWLKDSKNGFISGGAALGRTLAMGRADQMMEMILKVREAHFSEVLGLSAGLVNNLKGPLETFKWLLLGSKKNERRRKDLISQTSKIVLEGFVNAGRDLKKLDRDALSAVLLRSGAHVLMDHNVTLKELEQLLGNKSTLESKIKEFEGKLDVFGRRMKRDFIEDANGLGLYKAQGLNKIGTLKMNAYLIARRMGEAMSVQERITEDQANQAEPILDALVALYTLRYAKSTYLASVAKTLKIENARTDGMNGVELVLLNHKSLEKESLARLFGGHRALMMHGYTPEIYSPHVELVTADEKTGKDLVAMGYVKGDPVFRDPADPDRSVRHMYMLSDGGLQPHLTAVMSLTSKDHKGTEFHSGYLNPRTDVGMENAQINANILHQRNSIPLHNDPGRDLSKELGSFAAPIYNELGQIVNWRYLMKEDTKDALLKRTNGFEHLLGKAAGSIYDKETTQEQNEKAVQALYDQYQLDLKATPHKMKGYLLVGPKSKNPELREIWRLLPQVTRDDSDAIWGKGGMYVRSDNLDMMFGYRKLSIADMFKKDPKARHVVEQIIVRIAEAFLDKKAALWFRRGERTWQELVHEAKDIIVVKSGVTLLGNIYSNISMLYLNGVPWKDMAFNHMVALKGAMAYQKDSAELDRLRNLLATGYTQGKDAEIQRKVTLLVDAMARNPVSKLIEAGLMPTIVEDVAQDDDAYSYKSALVRMVDDKTAWVSPKVKSVVRTAYMAHDTKLYQGLSRITQLSDFVARYTLYQHLVSRKENPLSESDAIMRASDTFVNYDIPMHRGMQWSDDMGFTLFTKYFLGIQKEIHRVARENPARVMSTLLLGNFMALGPIVLEGSMWSKLGNNPLRNGAFMFPGSIDKGLVVSSALSLIK